MPKIIQISQYRPPVKGTGLAAGCQHLRLQISIEGEIITCLDCHKPVTAFWALSMIAEDWASSLRAPVIGMAKHECPFCGERAIRGEQTIHGSFAHCTNCGARGPLTADDPYQAWDQRYKQLLGE